MQIGEVFFYVSDQAAGYRQRDKYHVYITDGDWRHQGQIFLFINKSNAHGGSYPIENPPYDFLTRYPIGYVSCSGLIAVPDEVVSQFGQSCGRLSNTHLAELREFIAASDVMPQDEITLLCQALDHHSR